MSLLPINVPFNLNVSPENKFLFFSCLLVLLCEKRISCKKYPLVTLPHACHRLNNRAFLICFSEPVTETLLCACMFVCIASDRCVSAFSWKDEPHFIPPPPISAFYFLTEIFERRAKYAMRHSDSAKSTSVSPTKLLRQKQHNTFVSHEEVLIIMWLCGSAFFSGATLDFLRNAAPPKNATFLLSSSRPGRLLKLEVCEIWLAGETEVNFTVLVVQGLGAAENLKYLEFFRNFSPANIRLKASLASWTAALLTLFCTT